MNQQTIKLGQNSLWISILQLQVRVKVRSQVLDKYMSENFSSQMELSQDI